MPETGESPLDEKSPQLKLVIRVYFDDKATREQPSQGEFPSKNLEYLRELAKGTLRSKRPTGGPVVVVELEYPAVYPILGQ